MTQWVTALALATIMALPAGSAAAAPATGLTIPVVGSGPATSFTGTFTLQRFTTNASGGLVAVGSLVGTLTDTATRVVTSIVQTVAMPAAAAGTTCQILHLDLGPLSLNLLGLHVDLSRIVLDITAESGAGNLLGNLLCGVANLLNDPGGLAGLLNRILGAL